VTESRATPRYGTEDKSTFVLIQVFLCALGILEKNEPVWKNHQLDGLLRVYRGDQLLLTLPLPLEEHRESRPRP
jgi:hypothetical protein